MKKFVCLFIISFYAITTYATHIAGGELFYEYLGPGATANTSKYRITLRLFRECNSIGAALSNERGIIGIFSNATLVRVDTLKLTAQFVTPPSIQNINGVNPCLTLPYPVVCYQIGIFTGIKDLPNTPDGYTLSWIRYTRTSLANAVVTTSVTGATFTTQIPGTNQILTGNNSSPQFVTKDTAIVCKQTNFSLDFSAVDNDGDSLAYKFTPAYDGAIGTSGANADPDLSTLAALQTQSLTYIPPFSGLQPLGASVTIDPKTGIISGTAPIAGKYVVCVIVEEWRNGKLLNNHRKDFILTVNDCSLTAASLKPSYITCNGFTLNFQNESISSNIASYAWDFGVTTIKTDTSSKPTPTYTFPDTGVYTLKLKVTAVGGCSDSTTAQVRVFPGFVPNFSVTGSCYLNPYIFKDLTTTQYGFVNTWSWDFGETTVTTDTSTKQNPSYLYPLIGSKTITFRVTNSKGCDSTITKVVTVDDKPAINLPFKDTLICSIDTLPLLSSANGGSYSWSPNYNILNPNTANPLVYPKATTTYVLTVNNNGCVNKDSVKVNVLDFITVKIIPDTAICKTDSFQLNPVSQALSYLWTASTGTPVQNVKHPWVQPLINTTYNVTANLGKCQAQASTLVQVFPYPQVAVSQDTTICFGNRTQLAGTVTGTSFSWSPTNTLLNPTTLSPVAGPSKTTNYILTATNTSGCLKPVSDTITVTVIQPFTVNAGRDTAIVRGQLLQLRAIANITDTNFLWTPPTGLSSRFISSPLDVLNITADSIIYKVRVTNSIGCFAEDELTVHIFKTEPDIFVPSAFSPNSDGLNDVLKPIPVGIVNLQYFRIYNRWGQMLYSTSDIGKGWDGTSNGTKQPSGAYVYMAQGIDYMGKTIFRKGTVVLIR
jgi:gliding motility-associated-like protein